jgi:hypothetical protein
MSVGWYTDNALSRTVLESIPKIGTMHIKHFAPDASDHPSLFYGILRGCGRAMHTLKALGKDYYYIDNGYFDALYVDGNKHKDMSGKFRVVKNGMHEVYCGNKIVAEVCNAKVLIIPPSPYSANFYDTTPEDWIYAVGKNLDPQTTQIKIRNKDSLTPLEESLAWCDGVIAFNSMAVMKAIEMGKYVKDSHGILRHPQWSRLDINEVKAFYEPKQFTLEEFRDGKCKW